MQQRKDGNLDGMKLGKKTHSFARIDEVTKNDQCRCAKCGKSHELPNCCECQLCSLRSHWRIAQSKTLCFRCLLDGHQSDNCVKRNGCHEPNFDSKYYHLLHCHKSKPKNSVPKPLMEFKIRNPRKNRKGHRNCNY